jgi:hypothetical protein
VQLQVQVQVQAQMLRDVLHDHQRITPLPTARHSAFNAMLALCARLPPRVIDRDAKR